MKATELTHDSIGKWFRFSHDGFERCGRLSSIEFTDAYVKDGPTRINIRWKTRDDLTGYAHGIKPDAELTEVEPSPDDEATDADSNDDAA